STFRPVKNPRLTHKPPRHPTICPHRPFLLCEPTYLPTTKSSPILTEALDKQKREFAGDIST
ncbi:MAG: hypothetical protein ACLFU9_01715, partial [Candidatus Bathyarchaeia archaeon]